MGQFSAPTAWLAGWLQRVGTSWLLLAPLEPRWSRWEQAGAHGPSDRAAKVQTSCPKIGKSAYCGFLVPEPRRERETVTGGLANPPLWALLPAWHPRVVLGRGQQKRGGQGSAQRVSLLPLCASHSQRGGLREGSVAPSEAQQCQPCEASRGTGMQRENK